MNFVTNWAQGIIVAVIVATIIEMLLPNNGNGKYVKTIVGVFVLFSIVSPIINKFTGNSQDDILNLKSNIESHTSETLQTSNITFNNEEAIRKMYIENLKVDIKSKINKKGYTAGDINLEILNNDEYTLNKIEVKIISKNDNKEENKNQNATTIVENIENIKISIGGSAKDDKKDEVSIISESEKRKLREYLSGVYEVDEGNIIIS